jgi:hypothetical protein
MWGERILSVPATLRRPALHAASPTARRYADFSDNQLAELLACSNHSDPPVLDGRAGFPSKPPDSTSHISMPHGRGYSHRRPEHGARGNGCAFESTEVVT